jgi:hypothetical protein
MKMDQGDFQESFMRLVGVQKPVEVTQNSFNYIHEDFIMNNLLETIHKWATITLINNNTDIPLITSDSPVVYNNLEFFPTYLREGRKLVSSAKYGAYLE